MAKRLEDSLYRNASSFKEYKDHTTLRQRLQQLAARLGTNAQQNRAKVGVCSENCFGFGIGFSRCVCQGFGFGFCLVRFRVVAQQNRADNVVVFFRF